MPRMHVVGAWYTSGAFWTGAGVMVATLGVAATVWVTLTVGFPRRRLYYWLRAVAPLLTVSPEMRDLELRHRGTPLASPYVLTIELVSRGRKDIPSDAYNDHQPLELHVGSRIVEILQVIYEPETLPRPAITVDGTDSEWLRVGPSLLGRRQKITINVLTDGGRPSLSYRSPLIDVQVRERLGDNPHWTSAAAVIAGWAGGVLLAVTAENFALQKSAGWAAVAAAGAGIAALLATMILLSSRWRNLAPQGPSAREARHKDEKKDADRRQGD